MGAILGKPFSLAQRDYTKRKPLGRAGGFQGVELERKGPEVKVPRRLRYYRKSGAYFARFHTSSAFPPPDAAVLVYFISSPVIVTDRF